jgi:hypothetical protein
MKQGEDAPHIEFSAELTNEPHCYGGRGNASLNKWRNTFGTEVQLHVNGEQIERVEQVVVIFILPLCHELFYNFVNSLTWSISH